MLVGSGVEMTAPLMRCWGWGRNGASFAREMKLSPALSAVLLPQRLMSCVGRVLERVALGAPSTPVWECSPGALPEGAGLGADGAAAAPPWGLGVTCCPWGGPVPPSPLLYLSKPCLAPFGLYLGKVTAIKVGSSLLKWWGKESS